MSRELVIERNPVYRRLMASPHSDRLVSWINGSGLELGDERERLHLYEANTAALAVVLHLLPVVGAIAVLVAGTDGAWPIFAVVIVPALAIHLSRWYLHDQGVRVATQWLHMPRSRRYSMVACYDVLLAAMVAVGAMGAQTLVILVVSQAVGLWAGEKEMLRRHDDELAGSREPHIGGRRRRLSGLYLAALVLNTTLMVASALIAFDPVVVTIQVAVSVGMWFGYRQQRRREQSPGWAG